MMSAARWWQEFEYAAGHWFTKAAQAITGSVACLPGAFSAYRLTALESVLPKYSTRHTTPSEFLMKEMGEDRWMCALLILEGWQLSYTSLARVKTCVPQSFEELFNQRRRWLPRRWRRKRNSTWRRRQPHAPPLGASTRTAYPRRATATPALRFPLRNFFRLIMCWMGFRATLSTL